MKDYFKTTLVHTSLLPLFILTSHHQRGWWAGLAGVLSFLGHLSHIGAHEFFRGWSVVSSATGVRSWARW